MTVSLTWTLEQLTGSADAFATLEDAVRAWALGSCGLDADHVYFSEQDVRRHENEPRVLVRLGDFIPRGVGRLDHDYDAARPAGQEIEYSAVEVGELMVSLQAFAPKTVGTGTTARGLITRCMLALGLPQYRDALNAAGLGVLEKLPVQRLPQVVAGKWEDVALLEVRCSLTLKLTDRTGYIETVIYDIETTPDGET